MRVEDTSSTPDDYELMAGIAARNEKALRTFYDRHSALVFPVCLRIVKNRAEADDMLVDIFWEVWEKAGRFDATRGSPITYLMTLTRSRSIDRLRSRPRERSNDLLQDGPPATTATPLGDSINAETCKAVTAALAQLDANQRQAIECAFYDGLSHSEIADQLHKPLGTVKTYIRQGLIHLRESLRTEYRSK